MNAAFLPFANNRFDATPVAETTDKRKDPAIYWPTISIRIKPLTKREEKERENKVFRDLAQEAEERATEDRTATAITALEIKELGRRTVLETGSLGKAYPMMRECARNQLIEWGIDPALQDKIVRPAKSMKPIASYFRDDDYPRDALRVGAESVIRARLLISDKGAVTKCTSLSIFTTPGFAEVVCDRLKGVNFTPAELADGTKVPDFTTANIVFQMAR